MVKKQQKNNNNTNSHPREDRSDGGETGMSLFNRNIFNDPFFNDPMDSIFSFQRGMNDMFNRAFNNFGNMWENFENQPGTSSSKSVYKSHTTQIGKNPPKGETIQERTVTHIDPKTGKKYTEKEKCYENIEDKVKKITTTKFIDDKGLKTYKTHNYKTGEEYEHNDYRNMTENEFDNFNKEFDSEMKNVKERKQLGQSSSKRDQPALSQGNQKDSKNGNHVGKNGKNSNNKRKYIS
jgi:hypothetical protein